MFGKKIKNLRKTKNIKQDELAKIVGVTRSQISSYEIGRVKPSYAVLVKLANYFQKPLDYFYDNPESQLEELMTSLELSDQEFLKRVNLFYQGDKLTDEEVKKLLDYLRFLRSSHNK